MKVIQRTAQQIIWLAVVVVVIVAAILIFPTLSRGLQAPSTAISQSTQADSTPTPAGYPGPEVSALLTAQAVPTQTPEGYPGPEATVSPADADATLAAIVATMWAEATASAQGPTATPIVLVGPRTIVDSTGQYSFELPEGWWATALAGTSLTNYGGDKLTDVNQFPPGGMKVDIGIDSLNGRTVNEWLAYFMALAVEGENALLEGSGSDMTFTEVQALQLGPHSAYEYYMTTPQQVVYRQIAIPQDDRIIIIGIRPVDSPAMDEALLILSTLKFLPR